MIDERVYKEIFHVTHEIVIFLDKTGGVLEVNKSFNNLLGYSMESLKGANIADAGFIDNVSRAEVVEKFAKQMQGNHITPFEITLRTKDGKIRTGLVTSSLVNPDNGSPEIALFIVHDVTDLRQKKSKLESQKAEMEMKEMVIQTAMVLLGGETYDDALKQSLSSLGQYYGFERTTIFEDSKDGKVVQNTYEWVDEGVKPFMKDMGEISYEKIPSFIKMILQAGLIAEKQITSLPEDLKHLFEQRGAKAILMIPLYIGSERIGFVGFEDTNEERERTNEEIETLRVIASMIAETYRKKKDYDQFKEKLQELDSINKLMLGREVKIVKLKEEIERLKEKVSEAPVEIPKVESMEK